MPRTITRQGATPVGQRLRAISIPSRRPSGPLPEEWEWDETVEGDVDDNVEFDADLAYELLGDR